MGVLVLDKVLNKAAGIIALKILYKGIAGMKKKKARAYISVIPCYQNRLLREGWNPILGLLRWKDAR